MLLHSSSRLPPAKNREAEGAIETLHILKTNLIQPLHLVAHEWRIGRCSCVWMAPAISASELPSARAPVQMHRLEQFLQTRTAAHHLLPHSRKFRRARATPECARKDCACRHLLDDGPPAPRQLRQKDRPANQASERLHHHLKLMSRKALGRLLQHVRRSIQQMQSRSRNAANDSLGQNARACAKIENARRTWTENEISIR
jgi:hypothetical protein